MNGAALKKYTKLSAAAALFAGSAIVLSACAPTAPSNNNGGSEGTDGGGNSTEVTTGEFGEKYTVKPEDPTALADMGDVKTADGSIAYSVGEDEFSSYNGVQSNTYSTYNSAVVDRLATSWYYFGTDGTIHHNEDMGTYEKISDDPLTVKYTINPDAKWSDGTDVTTLDYQLQWAADNSSITNADGDPLFDSISTELGDRITNAPEGDPAGKEFTITYAEPYADWEILVSSALPAHVVAEQAGMSTEDLSKAIVAKDAKALAPAAKFWNDGWDFAPGELPDAAMIPSMGPYKIKDGGWTAGQSITLEANDAWWGTPPATRELVIRFSAADTHVQALQNGDLNVIEPQATVDTVDQLKGLGDQVVLQTGPELTWEHLDFNFMKGRAFADNLELRKAFAMCVPRQRIVDNLIKPIAEDAQVMNAREVFPFQDKYQELLDASYEGQYDEVDIEGAKKILEENDAVGTKVKIGYNAPNPRRTETVALIKSSCDEAGFEITDGGDAAFFDKVKPAGDYDVALFAWAGSGQKASGRNIYHTDGGQNDAGYSDATVDAAWDKLATSLDEGEQFEQVKIIEKQLWDTLFGIPLYAHPGVLAQSADVANVRRTAAQSGALWNVEQWVRVAE